MSAELFHADRRTDITKLTVAFRNFANAPKIVRLMQEERSVRKVFKNTPERKFSCGKPRKRWLHDDENYLKKMGIRSSRKIAKDDPEGGHSPMWNAEPVKRVRIDLPQISTVMVRNRTWPSAVRKRQLTG